MILEIEHRSIICANENQSVIERVFLPNHQIKDYKIPSLFDMIEEEKTIKNKHYDNFSLTNISLYDIIII